MAERPTQSSTRLAAPTLGAPRRLRRAVPFAAAVDGNDLARIRSSIGIEDLTQPAHGRKRLRRKNEMHVLELVETNAVFARDCSAGVHARGHDLPHGGVYSRLFVGIIRVVAD